MARVFAISSSGFARRDCRFRDERHTGQMQLADDVQLMKPDPAKAGHYRS